MLELAAGLRRKVDNAQKELMRQSDFKPVMLFWAMGQGYGTKGLKEQDFGKFMEVLDIYPPLSDSVPFLFKRYSIQGQVISLSDLISLVLPASRSFTELNKIRDTSSLHPEVPP